jgi:phosphoribosyl-AMP cyclohydrolase / phosphoribosyl-ATP pyrophosphohydrolase
MNALAASIDWGKMSDGLIPAIVQDADTAQVLMLGYMNREALKATLETGLVTFYSRKRQRLWQKGETSKHTLRLTSISVDCDGDALLVQAVPNGPTCHLGRSSCFAADELAVETIGTLSRTIQQRAESSESESYTRRLLEGGIAACGAKVLEEAEEVVRAAQQEGRGRTIEEAADVLYHVLVLLRSQGIELAEVSAELRKRRRGTV